MLTVLQTYTHVCLSPQVELSADPDSFFDAPCPTYEGFMQYSVESFSSQAHIKIVSKYGSSNGNGEVVVADTVFRGAAMEFGGEYRCKKLEKEGAESDVTGVF